MTNDASLAPPDFRATVANGRLTVVRWYPQLMAPWGPATAHFAARERAGVAVADLTVIREPESLLELVVRFLSTGGRTDARAAIIRWASTLGYARVWFPDDVVDLVGTAVPPAGEASTRCSSCDARWHDGAPEFWLHVRAMGNFPICCPLCGADMPQWVLGPSRKDREDEFERSTGGDLEHEPSQPRQAAAPAADRDSAGSDARR